MMFLKVLILEDGKYFAYEVLPAQYDQRADSAKESIRLLNSKSKATVRSGKLVLFNKELTDEQLELVESYLVILLKLVRKIYQFFFYLFHFLS